MADNVTIRITAQDSASPSIQQLIAQIQTLGRQAGATATVMNQTSRAMSASTAAMQQQAGVIRKLTDFHGLLALAYRRLLLSVSTYLAFGMAKQLTKEMDAWQNMRNMLRVVTGSTVEMLEVQKEVYKVAQASRTEMDSTVTIYSRLARSSKQLGMSQNELLTITKAINQGFVVSGATAQEARNAMIQLAQGFASGTLRGDELRSVMEQASYLAMKMAEGLGMTLGEFRKASIEGKISVQQLGQAITKVAGEIQRDFDRTASTVEQSMIKVKNAWGMLLDQLNREFNIGGTVAGALTRMANALDRARTGESSLQQERGRYESYLALPQGNETPEQARQRAAWQGIGQMRSQLSRGPYSVYMDMPTADLQASRQWVLKAILEQNDLLQSLQQGGKEGTGLFDWAKQKQGAEDYYDKLKQQEQVITNILRLRDEEKAVVETINAKQKEIADFTKEFDRLWKLIEGTGAKGARWLHGLPSDKEDAVQKMRDWWAVYEEQQAGLAEARSERYQSLLQDLRDLQAPLDSIAEFMAEAAGPSEEQLQNLKTYVDILRSPEHKRAVEAMTLSRHTAAVSLRMGPRTIAGRIPESGNAIGSILYDPSKIGATTRTMESFGRAMRNATDPKPVISFEWEWRHMSDDMRKRFLAEGGVFPAWMAAMTELHQSFGRLGNIIFDATTSGLQTFRAGLADAFGDLLFGEEEAGNVRNALQWIANTSPSPDSVLDVLGSLDMSMVNYSPEQAAALREQLDAYFEAALAYDMSPETKAKFEAMRAEVMGLLANPSDERRNIVVDNLEAMIENFTSRKSGLLDRFKEFGEDIVDAIQEGWKTFTVDVLTNMTMKAITDFGAGLITGLTGTTDQSLNTWGKETGTKIRNVAEGWINDIKGLFYGLGDFLKTVVIELGEAIAVTVSVVWDWGSDAVKSAWDFMVNGTTQIAKWVYVGLLKSAYWVAEKAADGTDMIWAAFSAVATTVTKTVNVALMKAGDWIGTAANAVYNAFTFVGGSATKTISVVINKAGDWIGESANAINNAFTFVGGTVTKTINVAINKAGDWAGLSANAVYNAFTSVGGAITKTIELAISTVGEWTADVWNLISLPSGSIMGTVTKAVAIAYGGAKNFVGDLWSIVQAVPGSTVSTVTKAITIAYGGASGFVGDLWNIVQSPAGTIVGTVYKAVAFAYGGAMNFVGDLWNMAQATAGTVVSTVRKAVSFVFGSNVDLVGDLWNVVTSVGGTLVSTVTKAIKFSYGGGINFIGDLWNILTAAAGTTVSTVKKAITMLFGGAEGFTDEVWQLIEAGAGETVNKAIRFVFGGTMNFVGDLWNIVKALGGTTVSTVNKAVAFIYGGVVDIAGELWTLVQAAAGTTASTVNKAIRLAYGGTLNLAGELWNIVQAVAGTTVSTVSKAVQFLYGGTSGFVGDLWNVVTALGGGLVSTVKKGVQIVYDSAVGFSGDLWNVVTAFGGGLVSIVKKGVQIVYDSAVGFAGDLWNITTALGGSIVSIVKKSVQFVLGTAIDFVGDLWEIAKAAPGAVVSTVQKIISFVAQEGADLIGGVGGTIASFWDWLTGDEVPSLPIAVNIDWDSILGTDPNNADPFFPLGDKFRETVDTSVAGGMIAGLLGGAAIAFAQGGSVFEAVSSGMAGAIGAAFGVSIPGVGGAAGAMIGMSLVPLIGGIVTNLTHGDDAATLQNLQTTLAQRGGLLGAIKYSGASFDVSGGALSLANPELRAAMKLADRSQAIDYLSQTLRTSLQIGSTPGDILARYLYWQDPSNAPLVAGTNQTQLQIDMMHLTQGDITDLRKALVDLGLATQETVDSLMASLGLVAATARITVPSDATNVSSVSDTPLAAAGLIVAAIDAAKASIVYAINGSAPRYQSGTLRVPGSPSTPVPAILHGGEMVIPYQQAEAIRSGGSIGSGVTIVFNISGNSDEGMVKLFRERITPEMDRWARRYLQDKSKYGQLEIHNKVLRSTLR